MRLVETRLLDGPNVYRLEPTVKLEVTIGRRRTWYGQRAPERHAIVRLRAPVPASQAPSPIATLAAWVRRLHVLTGSGAWLELEHEHERAGTRTRLPVTIHRSSDPGHWVVAFPWRHAGRATTIAQAAYKLTERDLDPRTTHPADAADGSGSGSASRTLARALRAITEADGPPPAWIRDADRRMPVVSISGTNGKSTTTRMIAHIMRAAGRHVGATTSDGVLIDGELIDRGDLTGPLGARRVLEHPDTEVAVLETARGGILLRGVGYESNDASVLTNISSDHMDLQGLHTLPELAEVKATIARITRPGGVVILNAEDELVAAVAREVRARVCFFALGPALGAALEPGRGPAARRLRRHLASGGAAMVLEDGWIVERAGTSSRRVVRVAALPATLGGVARHNVANALAAAAAARALGASLRAVREGLASYLPTAEQAPGRLNLYRLDGRLVIVDFAHNEAGVEALLDAAEGLVGDRASRRGRAWLSIIVGTAGDRPDDTLRGIGRIAAARADQVAIKETLHYLRGRTRASVIGEIRAGISASGAAATEVPVYEDEPSAVRGELTHAERVAAGPLPGVLLVMCHADREGVVAALAGLGATPAGTDDLAHLRTALR